MDSNSEVLLQLLVFEHSTGDVTVQTEVGTLVFECGAASLTFFQGRCLHIGRFQDMGSMSIREAIDAAVAEQFGRKPEPPYIERQQDDSENFWLIQHNRMNGIDGQCYKALCKIAGKELPVVDASESQPRSTWVRVFPPEIADDQKGKSDRLWLDGFGYAYAEMQKETAFTIRRLTVTR